MTENGFQYCGYGNAIDFIVAPIITCKQTGSWTLNAYDQTTGWQAPASPFTLSHGGQLGITSPTDNQLIDLAQDQNYTATDTTCPAPVNAQGNATSTCFSAGTTTGKSISWSATLSYATLGNLGSISDPRTFTTQGGGTQNEQYTAEGGQVQVTATTTASDGSTVQDCVTSYVEGPAGGIPGPGPGDVITPELVTLYTSSSSYPSGGTSNLMTGVAMKESSYRQFTSPADSPANSDLFALYNTFEIAAKWPTESPQTSQYPRGSFIGLMQTQISSNQQSDPNAWNWITNAIDAVDLFSGTGKPNKIQLATTYGNDIISGVPKNNPPIPGYSGLQPVENTALGGAGLENMALVLYGGWVNLKSPLSTILTQQYYTPQCPAPCVQGTDRKGNLTCLNGSQVCWQWVPNTANQLPGIQYVTNGSSDPWYGSNGNTKPGVRNQLQ